MILVAVKSLSSEGLSDVVKPWRNRIFVGLVAGWLCLAGPLFDLAQSPAQLRIGPVRLAGVGSLGARRSFWLTKLGSS
jgi:hypothetical protein